MQGQNAIKEVKMELLSHFSALLAILPTPSGGTPNAAAASLISTLSLWIARVGGLVAFVGAIKLALSIKDEGSKEQMLAVLVMVSGFMIKAAVQNLGVFNIPAKYSVQASNAEFQSILSFIGKWTRRVGAVGMLFGALNIGLSISSNDAAQKVNGLKSLSSGGIVVAVSSILRTFV